MAMISATKMTDAIVYACRLKKTGDHRKFRTRPTEKAIVASRLLSESEV